jgi:hypothetical protein
MSTHDLAQGLALCGSAIVLVRGRATFHGPVSAAARSDFEAEYRRALHLPAAPAAVP